MKREPEAPLLGKHILIHIFKMLSFGSKFVKSKLSTLSSLDKEESRPKPGRWFDRVAVRFAIVV
jgi:hypothetical protein